MREAANIIKNSDELVALKSELGSAVAKAGDMAMLDDIRVSALGKKGRITDMMKTLGSLPPEERKARGAALNVLKDEIAAAIDARQKILSEAALSEKLGARKYRCDFVGASTGTHLAFRRPRSHPFRKPSKKSSPFSPAWVFRWPRGRISKANITISKR